jgi:multiple sugar transport system permease protein
LATLTIFSAVFVWNDFMGPLIYLNSQELKTIQLGLRMFIQQYSADYALIMAASLISMIPVVILFMAFQRFFVEGIASSGIKG